MDCMGILRPQADRFCQHLMNADLARRQKSFKGGGPWKIKFADAAFWRLWDIRATYRSATLAGHRDSTQKRARARELFDCKNKNFITHFYTKSALISTVLLKYQGQNHLKGSCRGSFLQLSNWMVLVGNDTFIQTITLAKGEAAASGFWMTIPWLKCLWQPFLASASAYTNTIRTQYTYKRYETILWI